MEIIKIDLKELDRVIIQKTVSVIKRGGVVLLPTDTVYGLVADIKNKKAIKKIYAIKKRDSKKPLGVFVRDLAMAKKYVKIAKKEEKRLKNNDTLIFPLKKPLSFCRETLGIRRPHSSLILTLLDILKYPLGQTSANLSGMPSTNNIKEIIKVFRAQNIKPELVLDAGNLPDCKPSSVIDLTGSLPKILRK